MTINKGEADVFRNDETDVRLSNMAALGAKAPRAAMLGNKLNRCHRGGIYLPLPCFKVKKKKCLFSLQFI
ncbi:MAG: hypothetical protein CVU89_12330 [Firmicutes bacterium HGW-Firmicutes-14]|nr:MAG: hypothetical protein CVU89_12330 [Firmicutes bacterium HGW-Firmicutes-14]